MAKREFESQDKNSAKFWHIDVKEKKHTVTFGSLGTKGTSKTKAFDSPEDAKKDADRLVKSKTRKGYVEIPSEKFEDIYLVNRDIEPVLPEDVNKLEKAIGSLPNGYREFMQRCGGSGFFCDDISIYPPTVILDAVDKTREYMTFDHCDGIKALKGLKKADFNDIWVFGGDGIGDNYCYFPNHKGVLFIITHEWMEVFRHEGAFALSSMLLYRGRVRHPFPFFYSMMDKARKSRKSDSFHIGKPFTPFEVEQAIIDFFEDRGFHVIRVQMPPQREDDAADDLKLFIEEIDGEIGIGVDDYSHNGGVVGSLGVNKKHKKLATACLAMLESLEKKK